MNKRANFNKKQISPDQNKTRLIKSKREKFSPKYTFVSISRLLHEANINYGNERGAAFPVWPYFPIFQFSGFPPAGSIIHFDFPAQTQNGPTPIIDNTVGVSLFRKISQE